MENHGIINAKVTRRTANVLPINLVQMDGRTGNGIESKKTSFPKSYKYRKLWIAMDVHVLMPYLLILATE